MELLGRGDHGNDESNNSAEASPLKADKAKSYDSGQSSNENSPSKNRSADNVGAGPLRSSWQQLFEGIPHILTPSTESGEYTQRIYELLQDNLDGSRNRGNTKGGLSKDSEPSSGGGRSGKRAQTTSSSDVISSSEGVLLKPTPLHLASGSLASFPLSGVHNARLEGVASFGCNVVALIEAQIADDEGESPNTLVAKQHQATTRTLRISRRITEKRR